jgi:hypothetical protein
MPEEVEAAHAALRERRVALSEVWPFEAQAMEPAAERDDDPFVLRLPTLLVANKADPLADPAAELRAFLELPPFRYPPWCLRRHEIGPWLFRPPWDPHDRVNRPARHAVNEVIR